MIVAIIQMRTLKAEVEKVFMRTAIGHEWLGPKIFVNTCKCALVYDRRSENEVNIPQSGYGYKGYVYITRWHQLVPLKELSFIS